MRKKRREVKEKAPGKNGTVLSFIGANLLSELLIIAQSGQSIMIISSHFSPQWTHMGLFFMAIDFSLEYEFGLP
jgi:hypothetical protein